MTEPIPLQPLSTSRVIPHVHEPSIQMYEARCSICFSSSSHSPNLFYPPCPNNHILCSSCLRTLILEATAKESSYPPRCCPQLNDGISVLSNLRYIFQFNVLSLDETYEFFDKAEEWEEVGGRVYCHAISECGKFIVPLLRANGVANCRCGRKTCIKCGQESHAGRDCDLEMGRLELQKLAERKEWKRCWKCCRMVEKVDGCNTITCICNAEFCYGCGAQSGRCECTARADANPAQAQLIFEGIVLLIITVCLILGAYFGLRGMLGK